VPATWTTLTLYIYDSTGVLVRSVAAGSASASVRSASWSPQPYNPSDGPLTLSAGGWTFRYDGLDASGAVLRNGVYLFVLQSSQGGAVSKDSFQVTVLGNGGGQVSIFAAPNPVRPGTAVKAVIYWHPPAQGVDLRIYDLSGGLVRDFGLSTSPLAWDLKGGAGREVAAGLYFVCARVPGQRDPQCFKLMVAR
jgi:hypothetical protein